SLGPWPAYLFPGPRAVVKAFLDMSGEGVLFPNIGRSLWRLLAGYGISLVVGIPLGLLLGRSQLVREALGTPVLGMQSVPCIFWLAVALLWFGLSENAFLFVVIVGSVLAVALAAEAGVRNLNPLWIRAARTLGAKGLRLYTSVLLPASLPSLVSG